MGGSPGQAQGGTGASQPTLAVMGGAREACNGNRDDVTTIFYNECIEDEEDDASTDVANVDELSDHWHALYAEANQGLAAFDPEP